MHYSPQLTDVIIDDILPNHFKYSVSGEAAARMREIATTYSKVRDW